MGKVRGGRFYDERLCCFVAQNATVFCFFFSRLSLCYLAGWKIPNVLAVWCVALLMEVDKIYTGMQDKSGVKAKSNNAGTPTNLPRLDLKPNLKAALIWQKKGGGKAQSSGSRTHTNAHLTHGEQTLLRGFKVFGWFRSTETHTLLQCMLTEPTLSLWHTPHSPEMNRNGFSRFSPRSPQRDQSRSPRHVTSELTQSKQMWEVWSMDSWQITFRKTTWN